MMSNNEQLNAINWMPLLRIIVASKLHELSCTGLETLLNVQAASLILAELEVWTSNRVLLWHARPIKASQLERSNGSFGVCLCVVFEADAWSLSIWKLKVLVTSFLQPSESKQHVWCFIQHTGRPSKHTDSHRAHGHKLVMCTLTKHLRHTLNTHSSISCTIKKRRWFSQAHVYTLTEKSMFFLSWFTARGSGTGSVCLSTETDSPVKMDWSTLRVVERMDVSLMSAGTLSPTAKRAKGWKSGL